MANVFVNIPVLASNGAGAAVDVSTMGRTKSLVIGGGFRATVNVEYATDALGTVWAPLATFHQSGNVTIDVAAHWLRAVTSDYQSGAPNLDVGSSDAGSSFILLPLSGAATDVSALPLFKTVVTPPGFAGTIDVSEDGVSWAQIFAFQNGGGMSREIVAQFARVTGGMDVYIGGANADGASAPAFDPTRASYFEDFLNAAGLILTVAPPLNSSFEILTLPTNVDPTYNAGLGSWFLNPPTNPGDAVETYLTFTVAGGGTAPPDSRASIAFAGVATMKRTIRGSIGVAISPTDQVFYFMGGEYGIFVGPSSTGGSVNYHGEIDTFGNFVDLGVPVDLLPHTFEIEYTASDGLVRYSVDGVLCATTPVGNQLFGRYYRMETSVTDLQMVMYVDYDLLELTGLPR